MVSFHTKIDTRSKREPKLLYIRPYAGRSYSFVSTQIYVRSDVYEKYKSGQLRPTSKEARQFLNDITDLLSRAEKAVLHPFDFEVWKNMFDNSYDEIPLEMAYQMKIDSVRAPKTKELYTNSLRKLQKYPKEIILSEITNKDLEEIENWMLDDLAWSTIGMYMRCLRAVINHLRKKELLENNPFRKYKPPVSENVKKALTPEEIRFLLEYKDPDEFNQRAVDFWKICYLMFGKYPSDLKNLKRSQVKKDHIIFTHRAKTSRVRQRKEYIVPITPELRELLEKWSNGNEEMVFDFGNFHAWKKRINGRLKRIGKKEKFRIKLTLQTARHSAATKLLHSGASIDHIQDLLMHQSRKTSENYLDSFSNEYNNEFARKLLE